MQALGDVRPELSTNDIPSGDLVNAVSVANISERHPALSPQLADLLDGRHVQLGLGVQFATMRASLDGSVEVVVRECAEEQVNRIDTLPVVAAMAYAHAGRDVALVGDHPRHAMSHPIDAIDTELAIADAYLAGYPWPAFVIGADAYLRPEPLNYLRGEL